MKKRIVTKNSTSFQSENQSAVVHGAEGAYRRLSRGEPFIGEVRELYESILSKVSGGLTEADCEALGLDGYEYIELAWYETVKKLSIGAMLKMAADGNLQRFFDLAITRYNTMANGASKRREKIRELQKTADDGAIEAAIASARGKE